ncbi:MAG: hypothetical protein JW955_16380 [Sedimentisphaerales bacterium]|nr:hypothetical protein [Sedimentisphaerales bacterium]
MSGLICLATMELLIQTLALSALADTPTPPDANCIVIDDFESYTDEWGHRIFQTWIDGWETPEPVPGCLSYGNGATVGHLEPPYAEQDIIHRGRQSMPVEYNNVWPPYYSEAQRCYYWDGPQDWTVRGMNTLSLWFRGEANNSAEPFYVALEDSEGWTGVVKHSDPNALLATEWRQWQIRLTTFAFGPVDVTAVKQLYIGIGDREKPQPGGAGTVYIDDIRLLRCAPLPEPIEPDFMVIDDFESYTDEWGHRIFEAWIDRWETPEPIPGCLLNCAGATVGHLEPPYVEQQVVHGGKQSMPMDYNNVVSRCFPGCSETYHQWATPQDWSHFGMTTLSLWFRGEPNNSPEAFYVALEDSWREIGVVNHPDPNALRVTEWRQWQIPLMAFIRNRVDITAIQRMYIGTGDRQKPQPGGAGHIYIDDIMLMRGSPY